MAKILTIEQADLILAQDIASAHDRHRRRLENIAKAAQKPSEEERKAASKARYMLAKKLRDEGMTLQAIGDILGVGRQRVRMMVQKVERLSRPGHIWSS